ncbi:MAG TPA: VWA domain-containing protein, partial [Nannocystis sp.]
MQSIGFKNSWRRMCVQAGLLAGLAVAFVGGVETPAVRAAPVPCQTEGECTFKKPLFGILLDYSSSMNEPLSGNVTRWQAAVEAIEGLVNDDNGYIAESFILGLIRFGHDPDPGTPGSKIAGDSSGLVDGQRLDVPWYDSAAPDKPYTECTNGDAIVAALGSAGPPGGGQKTGISSWTKGAIDFAAASIAQTKADHPQDQGKRAAVLLLVTDGPWTNANGAQQLAPAGQDPKLAASALWMQQGVPTYVVALGEAKEAAFADTLAAAGGTTAAVDVATPQGFKDALGAVVAAVQHDVLTPACGAGLPRIMVLLDASSSMLNINGGMQHAPPGQGGWDQARDVLAGHTSMFDLDVGGELRLVDVAYVGLAVFGHNADGEHKLVVQYGPCHEDNIAWALDPETSCDKPGCTDPYAKPPITWTFKDGSLVEPMFADKTLSHMPRCDLIDNLPNACIGSATYTHLGLDLIQTNLATYKAECAAIDAVQPCNDATKFINILIADGASNSTDAQLQAPLVAMYEAGVVTHVIGFGDLVNIPKATLQLEKLADWGSGNTLNYYDANNQDQLEAALKTIVLGLEIDKCCNFLDCGRDPEPS